MASPSPVPFSLNKASSWAFDISNAVIAAPVESPCPADSSRARDGLAQEGGWDTNIREDAEGGRGDVDTGCDKAGREMVAVGAFDLRG